MSLALAILPIILTIACGYLLVVSRILPRDRWDAIDQLCFRLLMPAILIKVIATSDIDFGRFGGLIWSLFGTLILVGAAVFVLRKLVSRDRLPDPSFSTLFQTSTRFNGFMSLAAADILAGPEALALVALAMAVLVPFLNIINIVVLAAYGTARPSLKGIVMISVRNPLLQSCAIGLVLNFSGLTLPDVLMQTLDLIGRAAFTIGLLAVGAGLGLRRLLAAAPALWLGLLFRPFVVMAVFLTIAHVMGLGPVQMLAGALVFIVPAAANGYIVARQMGGDSDLYADIMTWQAVLSMLLLPALAAALPLLG